MMFNRQQLLPADVINGGNLLLQQPLLDFGNYFPGSGLLGGGESGFPALPPRKRAGKRDRHSKIYTAQGPRDRRVRLSIGIARRFFDLQEMLGFDKPSKTLDWLLTKSTSAIEELVQERNDVVGGEKLKLGHSWEGKSSGGDDDDKKRGSNSLTGKDHHHHRQQQYSAVKESRAKARARARARTREKMMKQIMNPNLELNPIIPFQVQYHHEMCRNSGCSSSTKPPIWGFQQKLLISRDLGFQNEIWGDYTSHSHPFYAILDHPNCSSIAAIQMGKN